MGSILVFLQQSDGKILKASLVALEAAKQLKTAWGLSDVCGVCLGAGASAAAQDATKYGVSRVLSCDDAALAQYRAVPYAEAIVAAVKQVGATTVVGPASSSGKDCFPRVAAKLDAVQLSDIIAVNSDGTIKRPMYAGNVLADVEVSQPNRVVTVRATAFTPAAPGGSAGALEALSVTFSATAIAGEIVSYEISGGGRPELGDAEVVVSGGRALASGENFEKFIFPLADVFGAAVGASRAAVDSGYAPNDWQVGQTGKVVAPNLYVAVGISGAIQHLAGMKDSKVIVAINKDPDAPIFEVADFGLVADLFTAVPELVEAVKGAKA